MESFNLTGELISRITLYPLVLLAAVFVLIVPDSGFADVDLRADLSYYETTRETDGASTTSSSITQIYTLGVRKPLTRTITFWGDVKWTINETNNKRISSVYPIFSLSFSPPQLYDFRFGYNRTESAPSEGRRISTSHLNTAFSLPEGRWPSLILTFNRSTTEDHETPKQIYTVSTGVMASTSYGFNILDTRSNVNYTLSDFVSEDKVNSTKSTTPSHQVSLSLSRLFLDGKIKSSANVGYELRNTTSESLAGPSRFEETIRQSVGLASLDSVPDPINITLGDEPELIDRNTSTPTPSVIDLNSANWNIGFGFAAPQSIFQINLFIKTTEGPGSEEEAIINGSYDFGWKLYTSSDNSSWTFVGSLTPVYNAFFNRFEFTFAETSARYFKLVNTAGNGTVPIEVTEIEAKGFVLSTPKQSFTSSSTRDFGGFNIFYTPTQRLGMGFTFSYDHSAREAGNNRGLDTTSFRYGTNLRYTFIPKYLSFTTNYSDSETRTQGQDDAGGRAYSFAFSTTPLDTLNGNLTYNHAESLTASTVVSSHNSTAISTYMKIYRGVDLGLGTTFSASENPQQGVSSDSRSYRWSFKLVPWRPLTTLISGSSATTSTDRQGATTSVSSESLDLSFSYSPTRSIHVGGAIDIKPVSSQSYSVTWRVTNKVQLGFRANTSNNAQGMGTSFNWQPFPVVTLNAGYNFTERTGVTTDKVESFFARASFVF
ncbi:MAG: hypothetical protein HY883_05305 [Deltaproteobacteria bacterium]|nr:hypothetical protein [Deltaproteobacteria bacterium]